MKKLSRNGYIILKSDYNTKELKEIKDCLLYTSDAADDSLRVDLGGRRIIKKDMFGCGRAL